MTAEEFQAHEERLADFDRLEEDVEEDFYDDIYEDILTFGEFFIPHYIYTFLAPCLIQKFSQHVYFPLWSYNLNKFGSKDVHWFKSTEVHWL